jgi:hypothetical protein
MLGQRVISMIKVLPGIFHGCGLDHHEARPRDIVTTAKYSGVSGRIWRAAT